MHIQNLLSMKSLFLFLHILSMCVAVYSMENNIIAGIAFEEIDNQSLKQDKATM